MPSGMETLTRAAKAVKPDVVVWERDPNLPGVEVGQPASVREFLENKGSNDPQAAWLLLVMCVLTRAIFWLRVVRAELTEALVRHDVNVWNCAPPLETQNAVADACLEMPSCTEL